MVLEALGQRSAAHSQIAGSGALRGDLAGALQVALHRVVLALQAQQDGAQPFVLMPAARIMCSRPVPLDGHAVAFGQVGRALRFELSYMFSALFTFFKAFIVMR